MICRRSYDAICFDWRPLKKIQRTLLWSLKENQPIQARICNALFHPGTIKGLVDYLQYRYSFLIFDSKHYILKMEFEQNTKRTLKYGFISIPYFQTSSLNLCSECLRFYLHVQVTHINSIVLINLLVRILTRPNDITQTFEIFHS